MTNDRMYGSEWHVIYNAILAKVSDMELKELLKEVGYPKLLHNAFEEWDGPLTFECFLKANTKQVGFLIEEFPELLDKAGNYFAIYGRQDIVHSLIEKGCNLDFIAIGALKGLRVFESEEIERVDKIYADANQYSIDYYVDIENEYQAQEGHIIKEKAQELYQTKMNLLDTIVLLDKVTDKNLDTQKICSDIVDYVSNNIRGYEESHIIDAKRFIESGSLKAINESIIKVSPECNLRDELYNMAMVEHYNNKSSYVSSLHYVYLSSEDVSSNAEEESIMLNKIYDKVFARAEAQDFSLEIDNSDLLIGSDFQPPIDFN